MIRCLVPLAIKQLRQNQISRVSFHKWSTKWLVYILNVECWNIQRSTLILFTNFYISNNNVQWKIPIIQVWHERSATQYSITFVLESLFLFLNQKRWTAELKINNCYYLFHWSVKFPIFHFSNSNWHTYGFIGRDEP